MIASHYALGINNNRASSRLSSPTKSLAAHNQAALRTDRSIPWIRHFSNVQSRDNRDPREGRPGPIGRSVQH